MLGTGVLTAAISQVDALAVLDLKNLTVTLRELRTVRADIYAKAEQVKGLGEEIASRKGAYWGRVQKKGGGSLLDGAKGLCRNTDIWAAVVEDISAANHEQNLAARTELALLWDVVVPMSDKREKADQRETTRRRTPDRRRKPITNRRGPRPGRRTDDLRKPERDPQS